VSYDVIAAGEDLNYTANMREFFKDFGVYPPDFDGKTRYQVADMIDDALKDIQSRDPQELATKYNAENGWGSVRSAVEWLKRVRMACRKELPMKVQVFW
jgi:hypothetical protein